MPGVGSTETSNTAVSRSMPVTVSVEAPGATPAISKPAVVCPAGTSTVGSVVKTVSSAPTSVSSSPPGGALSDSVTPMGRTQPSNTCSGSGSNATVNGSTVAVRESGANPSARAVMTVLPTVWPVTCGLADGVESPSAMNMEASTVATLGFSDSSRMVVPPAGAGSLRLIGRLTLLPGVIAGTSPTLTVSLVLPTVVSALA